jgi:TolB-like protein
MFRVVSLCVLALLGLVLGSGYSQSGADKPRLAILEFTQDGKATQLGSTLIEKLLLDSKRFTLLERTRLVDVLREDALAMGGVTTPQASEIAKKLNANFILTGNISKEGDRTLLNLRVIEVATAVIKAAALGEISQLDVVAPAMVRDLLREFPLEARVNGLLDGNRATLNKGENDGIKAEQTGRILRRTSGNEIEVATFKVTRVTPNQSTILVQPEPGQKPQADDLAIVGEYEHHNQATRQTLGQTSANPFNLQALLQPSNQPLPNYASVRLGQEIVLQFVPPIDGVVYIISLFSNEKDFWLLYPDSGFSPRAAKKSQPFEFPAKPLERQTIALIAQEPIGRNWLKAYILPRKIPNFEATNATLDQEDLRRLQEAVTAAGDKAATATLMFEIVR